MSTSFDYKSSYPFILCTFDGFPLSSFVKWSDNVTESEFKNILKEKCAMFYVYFPSIRIKPFNPITCISISKILTRFKKPKILIRDNGRLVSGRDIVLCCNEIDFKMILENYNIPEGYKVWDIWIAKKGKLPDCIRYGTFDLFKKKCELEKFKHTTEGEYNYSKFKNLLNACFGMSLTDIVHNEIELKNGEWKEEPKKDIQEELDKYFKNWNSFLYYPWGLYVTTYGRYRLTQLIKCCNDPYYWDTDSCKGDNWDMDKLNQLNEETINILKENDMVVTIDGKNYYLGIAELDGEYKKFKTMGAKKYAYIDENDKLHITIAGVNKSKGAKELGSLENFKERFIFKESGGQCAKYNDEPIHTITVGGVDIETGSSIAIVPSTYKLNSCDDYLSRTNFTIFERCD